MSKQAKKNPTAAHFESSMKELEQIVLKLESGELELEESLALFETGMQHSQACKQALEAAELKVRNLLESGHETEDSDQ